MSSCNCIQMVLYSSLFYHVFIFFRHYNAHNELSSKAQLEYKNKTERNAQVMPITHNIITQNW